MMRTFILVHVFLLCLGCSQEKLEAGLSNGSEDMRETTTANASGGRSEKASVTIFPQNPSTNVPLQGHIQGLRNVEEWRWYRNGDIIPDQISSILPGHSALRGDRITLLALAGGHEVTDSIIIGNSPPEVVSVGLKTNQIFRGTDVVALPEAIDLDGDLVDFRFVWFLNGDEVRGQSSDTLPGNVFRKGDTIALKVFPYDGQMEGPPYLSEAFTVPNGPPRFLSQPPREFTGFAYSYNASAEDPDGDTLTFALEGGAEGMVMEKDTGLFSWDLLEAPIGETEVTISVTDEEGLWARQAFTIRVGQ